MIREDEICLVLQGLINGVDYETGESYDFSDTVISSLKIVSTMLECDKRSQHTIDSIDSAEAFEKSYFEKTLKTLPGVSSKEYRQINEIIGDFYLKEKLRLSKPGSNNSKAKDTISDLAHQMFGIDIVSPKGRLSKTGWFYSGSSQIKCNICFSPLEVFRKPYTTKANLVYHYYGLVCIECSTVITPTDLHDTEERRSLYKEHQIDVYESDIKAGDKSTESVNKKCESLNKETNIPIQSLCSDCDCEISQERLDSVPDATRCSQCQSEFEKNNPDSVTRKFEDKSIMTREGAKHMRAKQYGTNIHNKN